ncbi:hypothetical protein ACVBEQ_04765 [Nakamurella sp. GG22]
MSHVVTLITNDRNRVRAQWRSGIAGEKQRDLVELDDLQGELHDLQADS